MSNALLSSKIVVTEEAPRIRSFSALPTAVLGTVGLAERGPIGKAVLSTSFDEWSSTFGGYTAETKDTTAAVEGFFSEGGQFLWFVRTVHFTDINDPNSANALTAAASIFTATASAAGATVTGNLTGPYSLLNGDTLVVSVSGGGDITSTFAAAAATITSSNAETYVLVDGQTLTISVDGEADQTATFNTADFSNIGLATAAEVAKVINDDTTDVLADGAGGSVVITNSRGRGTGFSINPTGGAAAATLGFAAGAVTGTGDAADGAAVTPAELITMFTADIAGVTTTSPTSNIQLATTATGSAQTLEIKATSTLDTKLGLSNLLATGTDAASATKTLGGLGKYAGAYGNDITVRIATASSESAAEFNLLVLDGGVVREQFPNLSMDDTLPNFAETIINALPNKGGSEYLAVLDVDAGLGTATLDRPANGETVLVGGDDGLTNLVDSDFIGSSIGENGLRALDKDDITPVTILNCPGRATSAVQNAMLTYAEVTRNGTMFALLDPPAGLTAQEMVTYTVTTALLKESSEYGAIYFPRVQILNPNTTLFGTADNITVAPTGHIAGRIARTDSDAPGGIYLPPAGVTNGRFSTVVGFELLPGEERPETADSNKRDLLYPQRINPLSEVTGARIIDGVRTLKSDGNFPTIAERRGVIFIEVTTKNSIEFARFRNNDDTLRAEVSRSIEKFLLDQMSVSAFRTKNPKTAFFVDFSEGLNPPSVVFAGQLIGRIGLATQKPAEFIILKFTQDTSALEQEIS